MENYKKYLQNQKIKQNDYYDQIKKDFLNSKLYNYWFKNLITDEVVKIKNIKNVKKDKNQICFEKFNPFKNTFDQIRILNFEVVGSEEV